MPTLYRNSAFITIFTHPTPPSRLSFSPSSPSKLSAPRPRKTQAGTQQYQEEIQSPSLSAPRLFSLQPRQISSTATTRNPIMNTASFLRKNPIITIVRPANFYALPDATKDGVLAIFARISVTELIALVARLGQAYSPLVRITHRPSPPAFQLCIHRLACLNSSLRDKRCKSRSHCCGEASHNRCIVLFRAEPFTAPFLCQWF